MRCFHANESIRGTQTGADPGFLVGGGANPPGGAANIPICQIFPKKLHEIKKILVRRVGAPPPPWIRHCQTYSLFLVHEKSPSTYIHHKHL